MWVLDRLEEQLAVLEDDTCTLQTVARSLLPPDAREGDVLEQTADGSYTLYVPELDEHYHSVKGARTESPQRRARILARQTKLRKK